MDAENNRKNIFLSYCRKDGEWLNRIETFIKTLPPTIQTETWSDEPMDDGQDWEALIRAAMSRADIAILIISADFLASPFIRDSEIPFLLEQKEKGLLAIFPILVGDCSWKTLPWLSAMQMCFQDKKKESPLSERSKINTDKTLSDFISHIYRELLTLPAKPLSSSVPLSISPEQGYPEQGNPEPDNLEQTWLKHVVYGSQLTPKEALGVLRARIFSDYYWLRESDTAILQLLQQKRSLLIRGNPLAGKSRALYEALRQCPQNVILIPRENPPAAPRWPLPPLCLAPGAAPILVLDDLDVFLARYGREMLESLLREMAEQGVTVAAAIRWGHEFSDIRIHMDRKLISMFYEVDILRLSKLQQSQLEHHMYGTERERLIKELNRQRFDGNIGALFLDLGKMESRFRKLEKTIRERFTGFPAALPGKILEALKYFYYGENMVGKTTFAKEKIFDFCRRSVAKGKSEKKKISPAAEMANLGITPDKLTAEAAPITGTMELESFTPADFEAALTVLGEGREQLNFIESDWRTIVAEQAYLERIVLPEQGVVEVLDALKRVYQGADLRAEGFLTDVYRLTRFLHRARTPEEGDRVLEKLAELGIKAGVATYNSLLAKAKNLPQARELLTKMRAAGITPNEVTYNTLLSKAADFAVAQGVLAEMRAAGITPDANTFKLLLSKTADFAVAQGVLAEMRAAGINPDAFIYTSLLNKTGDFAVAQGVLAEMRAAGITPNDVTYNALLNKAADFAVAQGVLTEMRAAGITPDDFTFNSLLSKTADISGAKVVLAEMRAAGIAPNDVTYNSLLSKAADFSGAKAVLAEMRASGIKPDVMTYNSLLSKAADFSVAQGVLAEMRAAGIKPDDVTYNSLLSKARDFAGAKTVLAEMRAVGIKPDDVTYSALLSKARDFAGAKAVLAEMRAAGIKPNHVTFNALLSKAGDFTGGQRVLAEMRASGIKPDEVTYNTLLSKAADFTRAKAVLAEMKSQNIIPTEKTYNTLVNQADSFPDALEAIKIMTSSGFRADTYTYTTLIKKAPGYAEALHILDLMNDARVKPDAVTFNTLIKRAPGFTAAMRVLELMSAARVWPSVVTYNTLIHHAPGYAAAIKIVESMSAARVRPDVFTYTTLMNKAPNFVTACAVLDMMKKDRIRPNEVTERTLLAKARAPEEKREARWRLENI